VRWLAWSPLGSVSLTVPPGDHAPAADPPIVKPTEPTHEARGRDIPRGRAVGGRKSAGRAHPGRRITSAPTLTMLVRDDETRALIKQLALHLAGQGTAERALGARLERLPTEGQGRLTIADLSIVRENLRSQKARAEALRDADAEAEAAEAAGQVALLETCQGALQRLFESERTKPSYLVRLKPEFGHLPDYRGRIEVGRTYRAFFSPDHADFMSLVGTDITHAQKRHFEIRPG